MEGSGIHGIVLVPGAELGSNFAEDMESVVMEVRPPQSRKQMSKLGARLIGPAPSAEDWAAYGEVIKFFDAVMGNLRDRVAAMDWKHVLGREVNLAISGRAKTRGTLLDKLRRTPEIGLGYIRDVAGVRIVGEFSLEEQDAIVRHLVEALDPQAKIIDRRAEPQAGYRAVHVIVTSQGAYAEIQVRTELQSLWAEVYERLGDLLGRGIRYGEPADVDTEEVRAIVLSVQAMSTELISGIEVELSGMHGALKAADRRVDNSGKAISDSPEWAHELKELSTVLGQVREAFGTLIRHTERWSQERGHGIVLVEGPKEEEAAK